MNLRSSRPEEKIAVTAVTGFLGAGKTHYLNVLLQHARFAHTVVIVNEIGTLGIDQASWTFVQPSTILLEGGCLCCQMQGSLNLTLQRMFADALAGKIPRFDRVLVETSGLADPAALKFTLATDFFLRERYDYNGCICIVDAVNGPRQSSMVEWGRQLALADLVLLSKTDIAAPAQRRDCEARIAQASDAPVMTASAFLASEDPAYRLDLLREKAAGRVSATLQRLLPVAAGRNGASVTMTGRAASGSEPCGGNPAGLRPVRDHTPVRIITLDLSRPMRRSVFHRALDALLARYGPGLIRIKALLRFTNDPSLYLYHVVHQQVYPAQRLPPGRGADARTGMVIFLDESTAGAPAPQAAQFYED